jgi:hypothetical protein
VLEKLASDSKPSGPTQSPTMYKLLVLVTLQDGSPCILPCSAVTNALETIIFSKNLCLTIHFEEVLPSIHTTFF